MFVTTLWSAPVSSYSVPSPLPRVKEGDISFQLALNIFLTIGLAWAIFTILSSKNQPHAQSAPRLATPPPIPPPVQLPIHQQLHEGENVAIERILYGNQEVSLPDRTQLNRFYRFLGGRLNNYLLALGVQDAGLRESPSTSATLLTSMPSIGPLFGFIIAASRAIQETEQGNPALIHDKKRFSRIYAAHLTRYYQREILEGDNTAWLEHRISDQLARIRDGVFHALSGIVLESEGVPIEPHWRPIVAKCLSKLLFHYREVEYSRPLADPVDLATQTAAKAMAFSGLTPAYFDRFTGNQFRYEKAESCGYLAQLTYESPSFIRHVMETQIGLQEGAGYIVGENTKIQYLCFKYANRAFVSFRGSDNEQNWVRNNVDIRKTTVPLENTPTQHVHNGFWTGVGYNWPVINRFLNIRADHPCPYEKIIFTGHSLGAAQAILNAYKLSTLVPAIRDRLEVYNFGQPRVGNQAFATHLATSIPKYFRLVNHADIVPTVPDFGVFSHSGRELRLAPTQYQGILYRAFSTAYCGAHYMEGYLRNTQVLTGLEAARRQEIELPIDHTDPTRQAFTMMRLADRLVEFEIPQHDGQTPKALYRRSLEVFPLWDALHGLRQLMQAHETIEIDSEALRTRLAKDTNIYIVAELDEAIQIYHGQLLIAL